MFCRYASVADKNMMIKSDDVMSATLTAVATNPRKRRLDDDDDDDMADMKRRKGSQGDIDADTSSLDESESARKVVSSCDVHRDETTGDVIIVDSYNKTEEREWSAPAFVLVSSFSHLLDLSEQMFRACFSAAR